MKKCKLLIIEDDDITRTKMAQIMEREGFEVLIAEDGKAGVNTFIKESPNIVITDFSMPNMKGIEVLKKIRKISMYTPIFLISASIKFSTLSPILYKYTTHFLQKPIDLNKLMTLLEKAMESIAEQKENVSLANTSLHGGFDRVADMVA